MRIWILALALSVSVLTAAPGNAQPCEEQQDIFCDYQCYWFAGWSCNEPSDRCCYQWPGSNNCGDASYCEECDCSGMIGGL